MLVRCGEVAQTLLNTVDIPFGGGADLDGDRRHSHPYARAISTATRLGIISGDTDRNGRALGTDRPDEPVNRAEAAKIVSEMLSLPQQ